MAGHHSSSWFEWLQSLEAVCWEGALASFFAQATGEEVPQPSATVGTVGTVLSLVPLQQEGGARGPTPGGMEVTPDSCALSVGGIVRLIWGACETADV